MSLKNSIQLRLIFNDVTGKTYTLPNVTEDYLAEGVIKQRVNQLNAVLNGTTEGIPEEVIAYGNGIAATFVSNGGGNPLQITDVKVISQEETVIYSG